MVEERFRLRTRDTERDGGATDGTDGRRLVGRGSSVDRHSQFVSARVLLLSSKASADGDKPLARIISWGIVGLEPAIMAYGPVPSSRKALEKAGLTIDDIDRWEINEAFAGQAVACVKDLGLDIEKVNVNGGAIAIGHPIGASGCRVLVTLLHEMKRRDAKKGLATLCIGGGLGVALAVER